MQLQARRGQGVGVRSVNELQIDVQQCLSARRESDGEREWTRPGTVTGARKSNRSPRKDERAEGGGRTILREKARF